MPWYRDLEPADLVPGALAVGWLGREHTFSTGTTREEVFRRLRQLFVDPFQPLVTAGSHGCTLCQFEPERRGTANLFVPGQGVIYVCPELILHYINAHRYAPPPEFCEAVLKCPDTRTMEYKKLFLANGGRSLLHQRKTPVTYVLAPGVEREIVRLFASDDVDYVRTRLAAQELPMDQHAPPPRVHIAVIWLSKGDRTRFDHELNGASGDWRDTLGAAGLANSDWREVLMRRGVDLSGFEAP